MREDEKNLDKNGPEYWQTKKTSSLGLKAASDNAKAEDGAGNLDD